MRFLAAEVTTIFNHSCFGLCDWLVLISTTSPLFRTVLIGTKTPLTFAPIVVSPTSV
jgi:hypothetical protein